MYDVRDIIEQRRLQEANGEREPHVRIATHFLKLVKFVLAATATIIATMLIFVFLAML